MKERLESGEALILKGKWEEAEKHFEAMNADFPEHPDILNNLGIVKEERGFLWEAENCFAKAVKITPQHHNALINLAQLFAKTARWRLAAKLYEGSVKSGDVSIDLYNQMAVNYLNMGAVSKAEKALAASLKLDPGQSAVEEMLHQIKAVEPQADEEEGFSVYRAAFTEINITPPVSASQCVLLQGMAGNPREASSVAQPLMMQSLLLEDENYTRILIVTADIFGFDNRMVEEIRHAASKWGILPEGILLNASHTHYAPGTMSGLLPVMGHYYEDYADQITALIIKNLNSLYQRLESCRIFRGATEARIGINRRLKQDGKIIFGPNPVGPYDRHTPFAIVDLCDSDQIILMINHGCHPTGIEMGGQISCDYPGYLRETLVSGGFAKGVMFLQGAAGDVKEAVWNDAQPSFAAFEHDAKANGQRLAAKLVEALQRPVQPLKGSFYCKKRIVKAPLKSPIPIARMEELAKQENSNALIREWANRFLDPLREGSIETEIPIEIQWISIGDQLRFIGLQGEPVSQLAKRIRSTTANPEGTFLLGYTNGIKAYIPTDEMIIEGGYEVEFSHCVYPQPAGLDRGIEGNIIGTVSNLSESAERTGKANGYGRYHFTGEQKEAFFVMSAGRCGTMTLAHILNTADNAVVWHHPQPDPILESLQAYHGLIDKREAFWKARRSIISNTWAQGKIHGETDLLMTPFCDVIAHEIKDAKFLILTRHPAGFVRSGMRRRYYDAHPWDFGRLQPIENKYDINEWNEKDQFDKVCWLWRETYQNILKIKDSIRKDRIKIVRFEDLIGKENEIEYLFQFLGLKGFDPKKIANVLTKKMNAQHTGNFPQPHEWPGKLTEKLWGECGQVAERFGYSKVSETVSVGQRVEISNACYNAGRKLLILESSGTSTGGHLDHIVASLKESFDVRYIKTGDTSEIPQLVAWADIVWLEWANEMAVHTTNNVPGLKKKQVICRLHGYEVFTNHPANINWEVVDQLIFVAKHKQILFKQKFGSIPSRQTVVRNGVDLSRFSIPREKANTKKLVLLGHLNFRKGLPLLLQFYHRLLKTDNAFYLYIRGEFQDPRLEMAARTMIRELSLHDKLEFVDWVDDLDSWFADKSHILSFSLEESFHYAIGNGMAAGLKPVIHAWTESREIWPSQFIFRNVDDFIDIISQRDYVPQRYRKLLEEYRLTADVQFERIEHILSTLGGGGVADGQKEKRLPELFPENGPDNSSYERSFGIMNKNLSDNVQQYADELQKKWFSFSPHNKNEVQTQVDHFLDGGRVQTVKCERLAEKKSLWEVEFGIEMDQRGVCLQFVIYDEHTKSLYCPFDINKELKEGLKRFTEDCIEKPHFRLGENNRGKIHDQVLLKHIEENFQEYVWERMYPGTVFTPLNNFLRHMNRYRYVRRSVRPDDVVVDAACGIGYGSKYLSAVCRKVYGADISKECLDLSKKFYHDNNIKWLKEDISNLSLPDNCIDVFVSMETFEHLDSPGKMLLEINRCLKKGGHAYLSTPNGGSPERKQVNNPYHYKEYNFNEMMAYAANSFSHVDIFGVDQAMQFISITDDNNHAYDNLFLFMKK